MYVKPRSALVFHRLTLGTTVIVKASSGPRYVVGCRSAVPREKLKMGVRVSLDMTTLTIMRCAASVSSARGRPQTELTRRSACRILPREVDPLVYNMTMEDPNGASFAGIGGLSDQIRELREVCGDCDGDSESRPSDRA